MPAQSNRGIWVSPVDSLPKASGVKKCEIKWGGGHCFVYYYFSAKDKKWYTADGFLVTSVILAWGQLSR
jgi:hypothetical protein